MWNGFNNFQYKYDSEISFLKKVAMSTWNDPIKTENDKKKISWKKNNLKEK